MINNKRAFAFWAKRRTPNERPKSSCERSSGLLCTCVCPLTYACSGSSVEEAPSILSAQASGVSGRWSRGRPGCLGVSAQTFRNDAGPVFQIPAGRWMEEAERLSGDKPI